MDKSTSSDMLPKKDHDKNVELDKKIEALRRKNAALMKRYQEVEEDKKKAEEDGMALQSRKGKADDLSITICKSTSESRMVTTKLTNTGSDQDRAGDGPSPRAGHGQRKELTVTMPVKKGKRVVTEKTPELSDAASDDGQSRHVESRRVKAAHIPKTDTAAQEEVSQGEQPDTEQQRLFEDFQASTDLNIPTSKEEQEEYLRWKQEREQIDRERVARHKNAKGQWRRAWDVDKADSMFLDKSGGEWLPSNRGGRNSRRGQNRTSSDSKGQLRRGKAKEAKNVQAMGSKAKGKDRLTGRARRWESSEDGNAQDSEAALEEFLEELDALAEMVDERKVEDEKAKAPYSRELGTNGEITAATNMDNITPTKADSSASKGSEKKVRFSDEQKNEKGASPEPPESMSPQSQKGSFPKKKKMQTHKAAVDSCMNRDGGGKSPAAPLQERKVNECNTKSVISPSDGCTQAERADPSVEVGKCNMTSTTDELIDSGLSVLSKESGEPHQAHSTSSDKAREHGKIV